MKILLALSLVANVILGLLYYKAVSRPPIERIIMEHGSVKAETEEAVAPVVVEEAKAKKKEKASGQIEQPIVVHHDGEYMAMEYKEALEDIENDKHEYLTDKLGLSEETIKKERKLRTKFGEESMKIFMKNPNGQVSIADRRKLLDMEEELDRKVVGLYGKENWQKFQNFQKKYNEGIFKRVKERNAPTVLMSP
jgi:hypothetical protein